MSNLFINRIGNRIEVVNMETCQRLSLNDESLLNKTDEEILATYSEMCGKQLNTRRV